MALMRWLDQVRALRSTEQRLAWSIAIAADAIQIGLFPLFAAGGFSPVDAGLDLVVAALLSKLLGWHWAFLPSFFSELIPGFDLFPTWTAAVYFVTRKEPRTGESTEPEILPPSPVR